jgi:predicted GNAT family N-acyltransferase
MADSEGVMEELHIIVARTPASLAGARRIRERVFIREQACPPELEWDAFEDSSIHYLGLLEGVPVAVARRRQSVFEGQDVAKLERFAVLPEYRGRGFGREMVWRVIDDALAEGYATLLIHAQKHLEEYYAEFGFRVVGDPFDEAGIPHIRMLLDRRVRSDSPGFGD